MHALAAVETPSADNDRARWDIRCGHGCVRGVPSAARQLASLLEVLHRGVAPRRGRLALVVGGHGKLPSDGHLTARWRS